MSDNDQSKGLSADDFKIPESSSVAGLWKKAAGVGVVGLLMAGAGFASDAERFGFSWLMGFYAVLTMFLGTFFFVCIQHLTFAGWSVTVRRTAEFFVGGVIVIPFLFLPNLMSTSQLYPWWDLHGDGKAHAQDDHGAGASDHGGHGKDHGDAHADEGHAHSPMETAAHHAITAKKAAYLNQGFFHLRWVVCLLIWLWIALRLHRLSTAQDANGDPQYTVKAQRFAPAAIILFALSLTFFGFDWLMSLEPNWFSTMFGVRIFASSAVLGLALIILLSLSFKNAGVVKNEINVEHYHDLGKLMFGFLVFWAYISFSEFFLIWYASIPEEVVYYHMRWDDDSWRMVSSAIVGVKFIIPFFFVMSRNIKRRLPTLRMGALWLVVLHFVEMYYWVMPHYYNKVHHGHLALDGMGIVTDVGCFMACVGIYLAVVFKRMLNHPVIPVKDPRLGRALGFVNA
ncbi:MAG: hypothetical protein OXT09_05435 [Myxococcales bacterium]|nr:hypothetical protein [Myxococcales bacterium]